MLTKDAIQWPDNNSIKLYIRNTGTSDATISAVCIGTSATNLERVWEGTISAPANGEDVAEITISLDKSWANDTRCYFKVVPSAGAPLEFSEKSP